MSFVLIAIKVHSAVDPCLFATTEVRKWWSVPDNKVGVFANFQRADVLIDSQLFGGIQRHELQRFHRRNSSVFHGLGGFLIQVSGQFRVIGIEGHHDARSMHDCAGIGNGVVHFKFVSPPVSERGTHRAVLRHRVGDFVAFQYVLERADGNLVIVQNPNQREYFVLPVAVTMNPAITSDNFTQRVEFQISPGWQSLTAFLP